MMIASLLFLAGLCTSDSGFEPRTPALLDPRWSTIDHRSSIIDSTVVIYLVRHAEKADDSRDPPLSEAGKHRADLLADLLRDAGITAIWSTQYQRTLATAAPLASRLGLEVRAYHPGDVAAFAAILLRTPGRHLVVGHSNTTPDLARALGGEPHGAIQDSEYDRLYTIVASGGQATTVLLRFGDRSAP